MWDNGYIIVARCGRSPHGERGLKCTCGLELTSTTTSLSSWRAWIEIVEIRENGGVLLSSLSSWRAWIEILTSPHFWLIRLCRSPHGERGLKFDMSKLHALLEIMSLSSWRAWIEIVRHCLYWRTRRVALLMESVD